MDQSIASFQSKGYIVATPVYEGPLDLLLQLIERAELDITRLALAQVTDQYLEHLRTLQEQRAEEVSAFLVIAARLVQIKSEALLPRPPVREPGEEDPGDALVRQLLIYKRFKDIAIRFAQLEADGRRTYLRLAPAPHFNLPLDLDGLGMAELLSAARAIFLKEDERIPLGDVVSAPKITIREKIRAITGHLRQQGSVRFSQLFSARPTILEIVVTFLAMLELIIRQVVSAQQEGLFGEILIENTGLANEDEDFELEFGE